MSTISRMIRRLLPKRRWQVTWEASFEPFGRSSGVFLTRREKCWTRWGANRFARLLERYGVYNGQVLRA